ncbi:MAG: DEAD/DEAH box helicase [Desulfovermiculus sp.]|nr:DEAD/DEAH box helicase [Desulfovermiculus sp.]
MNEIRLHPQGKLILDCSDQEAEDSPGLRRLRDTFASDWRAGLFALAADMKIVPTSLTMRFWREIAAAYLTKICHLPESDNPVQVGSPSIADYELWISSAPPMVGGEYLSQEVLARIWDALSKWGQETIAQAGGLEAFIHKHAPGWNRVGRVTFHLAENKQDEHRPFAFMATFTTGLGTGGRAKHVPLRKALELYSGSDNKQGLVRLLSPVHAAAKRCTWVQKMVSTGQIYHPMAWTADQAYQMLSTASILEECGLSVRLPDWWSKRPRAQVQVTIDSEKKTALNAQSLLDFNVDVAVGDMQLSQEEIDKLLAQDEGLVFLKGRWVEVDQDKLGQALEHWKQVAAEAKKGQLTFIEGMRLLAGTSRELQEEESEEERQWVHVSPGSDLQEILTRLRDPGRLESMSTPEGIRAELRPYQKEGVSWLAFLTELGMGACLADDMGLGKTLQVLALLVARNGQVGSNPALLIIPASLVGNWKNEAERFAPGLKLKTLHPSEASRGEMEEISKDVLTRLSAYDLVITTYSMVHRLTWLKEMTWSLVILDEAQAIKNPSTRQTKAVKKLPAQARIALTGTPIENRLGDLWSLFDFLNPGLLGSAKVFQRFVKSLQSRDQDQFGPLRKLAAPYILRRLKTDEKVISDLPEKTETVRYCNLTKLQVKHYTHIVQSMQKRLQSVDNMARRGLVLQTLMRLKQVCNHPSQLIGDGEYRPESSGKFNRIQELCAELAERQEKVLIFTQFREIIPALEEHLSRVFGQPGLVLHGSTQVGKRRSLVEQFQDEDGPPFFILSLKAGGTGLNLTAASHVIHFDRWWNPAVENQATDRTFRIGQRKNVLVHKFVTRGTIEERIDQLIEEKKELAEDVLSGSGEVNLTELPDDEILDLVSLDVNRAMG